MRARRTIRGPVTAMVMCALALGKTACGDSGSGASQLDLRGVLQTLRDNGIACDASMVPQQPSSGEDDSAITKTESFECTVEGSTIEGVAFGSGEQLDQTIEGLSIFCGIGPRQIYYVSEGTWMLTAVQDDGRGDQALTAAIAQALDTDVDTMDCNDPNG